MPIDPAALAQNLSALAGLDAEGDLRRAMQQLASAAKTLLRVDGAGLMLADERGAEPVNSSETPGRGLY
jgi:hypothetical protein